MAIAAASVLGASGGAAGALGDTLAVFDRSYKGSHLSTMVELLAGPLVPSGNEGSLGYAAPPDYYGNLVLAFDPELLGDRERFQRDVEAVLNRQQGGAGSMAGAAASSSVAMDASAWAANAASVSEAASEVASSVAASASAGDAASVSAWATVG